MTRAETTSRKKRKPADDQREIVAFADRLPPQSLSAEMSLLGSMMLSRDAVSEVLTHMNRDEARWFYRPDHGILFQTLIDLYDRNEPIDLVTLREELNRRGELERVGGIEYLVRCAESVPSYENAAYYTRIVRDKGILRDLIGCIGRIADRAYADSEDTTDLLDWAEKEIFDVTERRISGQTVKVGTLLYEVSEQLQQATESQFTGLPTGFHELDELTSGFQPGDLVVLAGRPSMGKTAIGLNMAENMAVDDNIPVAFFSLEMSRQQVAHRLICGRAAIDSHRFRRRMLNENEKHQVLEVCGMLQDAPLYIDDTPGLSIMELRAKTRRLHEQYKVEAIFIDYLQLMRCPGSESRQQEITSISQGLKSLGRELNIPIVAMAQLNRQSEGREGHRPRMSDLRESGAIEQDADVILLIHRESYYKRDDPTIKNLAELILAKQRNGPTDTVQLTFQHELTRFGNFSPVADPGYVAPYEDSGAPF